jgi:predicted oxidoreductase
MADHTYQSDVVIVGGGLAGIAAAFELLDQNLRVLLLERDEPQNLGGLARESFGGVMLVDTPLQRRSKIVDSPELAFADWLRVARFGEADLWPKRWAESYTGRSIEMIYEWLTARSIKFLPLVNWPERGMFEPGNSVPRWHIAWGTGKGLIETLLQHLDAHPRRANLQIRFGHRVERLLQSGAAVCGCAGQLEAGDETFAANAAAVLLTSGGICGGDLSLVRKHWYRPWGAPPKTLLNGSHRYADGLLHEAAARLGGRVTHLDKQWHYAAGIRHPQSPDKGLSLVPPRSALWLNAHGKRIGPPPLVGYTDTRYLVEQVCKEPGQYSWQVMNWKIAIKELAVSGCDYMTAFRDGNKLRLALDLIFGNRELVRTLIRDAHDVVVAASLPELVQAMNGLGSEFQVDAGLLQAEVGAYDAQIDRGERFFSDDQLRRIANFRTYRGDRLRTCKFQKIDDPKARPLIAIREHILSRKSLGGVQTDLACRVLDHAGTPIDGLFAAGETAGFGGGGSHGSGALEGTFLGGCILTGRIAGRAIYGGPL